MWANYIRGIIHLFHLKGYKIDGFDLVVCGNIPQGTGLSSSASLLVVVADAINTVFKCIWVFAFTCHTLTNKEFRCCTTLHILDNSGPAKIL